MNSFVIDSPFTGVIVPEVPSVPSYRAEIVAPADLSAEIIDIN